MIKVTLRDTVKEFNDGINAYEIAKSFGGGFYKNVCAARINGVNSDLRTVLKDGDTLELLTFEDEYGRWTFRHTASHIMAQAVKRLYPNAKLAIGPAVDDGFYYDFDIDEKFTPDDLKKIEAEIERLEARSEELDVLLADEAVYTNHTKLLEVTKEKDETAEKLLELMEQWENLA